jgi:hypothetical protein
MLRAKDYSGFNSLHVQNIYTSPEVNNVSLEWTLAVFPYRVKQPVCEIDELPPPSATFMNEKSHTSPPLHAFIAWTRTTAPFPTKTCGP